MKVLGLMSGTSADGVDAAIVEIHGAPPNLSVELLSFTFTPYDAGQRERIFALFDPATATVDRVCQMNFRLGEWFAASALQAIEEAGLSPDAVALIGSHGQTIYHAVEDESPVKSTLQIGEPAVIAARTGLPVVADFRVADVAAGGQGAPLTSYVDWLLLRHPERVRAVQNIGGIANVTYLPPGDDPSTGSFQDTLRAGSAGVLAFDTGPGNMLIDYAARRATNGALTFDRDGALAARGRVNEELLAELMAHPYLAQSPPKTTGRELFGEQFGAEVWARAEALGLSGEDVVATLTAFTAASIADAYRCFLPRLPDEVVLGGGGASNPILVARLRERLAPAAVRTHEAVGISSDAKEAIACAVLAYETWHGRPGNLPQVTGAACPVILGHITPAPPAPPVEPAQPRPTTFESLAPLLPVTARVAVDGHLWIAGHDTVALADEYGTPLYLYDGATFRQRLAELRDALASGYPGPAQIAYASKALLTPNLARRLAEAGIELDTVSGGEMALARQADFDPALVHLHGNNKRPAELREALDWGVGRIVVDNLDELGWLEELAAERKRPADIWLRLTPGVEVDTHAHRKTGHAASKFGLHITGDNPSAVRALARAQASPWLNPVGVHTHLGSQFFELESYVAAVKALLTFAADHDFVPAELSPGGGLGVPYTPDEPAPSAEDWIAAVSQAVMEECRARDWPLPRLVLEPGRWLIAPAGVAFYRVGTRKTAADGTRYVAVDGGLADNLRPALYGARYTAFLGNRATDTPDELVTVVGRFCESGDVLVRDVVLPTPQPGDLLAMPVAGAYQLSMASRYNLGPVPVPLWLDEGRVEAL